MSVLKDYEGSLDAYIEFEYHLIAPASNDVPYFGFFVDNLPKLEIYDFSVEVSLVEDFHYIFSTTNSASMLELVCTNFLGFIV
jgi:hypothetical protein